MSISRYPDIVLKSRTVPNGIINFALGDSGNAKSISSISDTSSCYAVSSSAIFHSSFFFFFWPAGSHFAIRNEGKWINDEEM